MWKVWIWVIILISVIRFKLGINTSCAWFPPLNWNSITCSSDGTRLAAVVGGAPGQIDNIYISADSGKNWFELTSSGQRNWQCVASSSDGTKMAAVSEGRNIFTSP
jgi:hypothetical protein